jgi:heme/copper-type cytochrome/quinol oxidase subunit 2
MSKRFFLALLLVSTASWAQLREGAPGTEAWIAVTHDGVQRVNVECAENVFDPNEIVVRANVPVELSVRGTSDSLLFVNQAFSPENKPIGKIPSPHRFQPSTPGRYEMSCQRLTGPPGRIMKGVLTVRP